MGLSKIISTAVEVDADGCRPTEEVGGLRIDSVVLEGQQYRPLYLRSKRALDVVLSVFLLVAFSPVLLLVAILIKLDSVGPVIFVQQRVGVTPEVSGKRIRWKLRSFAFFKFRSMVQNADPSWHQASVREFYSGASGSPGQGTRSKTYDTRVTQMGRFLRKTSLDELPQLINVLKGDMSLIGPRPVPLYEVALYQGSQFKRLAAIPGITGIWQASGRCRVPFEEMVRMDVYYARHASLWLDMKILFLTIPAVLFARGAE
jgi:lipopolysaccharide/colanic/teichoic acid biosynthesis glycosyltransferase